MKEGVELLNKWSIIRDLRSNVQMEIERQREKGLIGSSLQAEVSLKLPQEEYDLIKGLGDEAAFVMITSKVTLDGISPERVITVKPSEAKKCERCLAVQGKRRGRQELSDTVAAAASAIFSARLKPDSLPNEKDCLFR